jgi:ATP-dependent DNA ligase
MSTIPLAKGFSEKHLSFPVIVSRKYDGVPVRIDITEDGWTTQTRQGKPMPSVETLVQEFVNEFTKYIDVRPVTLIGEVIQWDNPGADFKDTSGIVRRQYDQSDKLGIMLFDCQAKHYEDYRERIWWMRQNIGGIEYGIQLHRRVSTVKCWYTGSMGQLLELQDELMRECPHWEGLIARNHDDPWSPGKRSWGYQKMLYEPTIDLRIVGVEEAIDKDGNPKGMAGRLVASYNGTEIGIGPGRLTHAERVELWEHYQREASHCCCGSPVDHYPDGHSPVSAADYYGFPNRIAQIKYKEDDSYDALRQPTFQHWRDDKSEPDA